jgi:hypothetical protein
VIPGSGTFPGASTFPGIDGSVLPGKTRARFLLDLVGDGSFATDITGDVRTRDPVVINRGRPDEASTSQPSTCALTLNNRSGNYSPRNPVGAYYGKIGRNTPLMVGIDTDATYLAINVFTGNRTTTANVTTPDTGVLDIVGDIDIRVDVDLDSWRDVMALASKWNETGNQRSWALAIYSSGRIGFDWSTNGTNDLAATSTVTVPIVTGRLAVRMTMAVSSGGTTINTFYTAPTINDTWTQLGDPVVTAGTTNIFASTAALTLLDNPNFSFSGSYIRGKMYAAEVRNGIGGTVVAAPDFTAQTNNATSFTDPAGRVWTLNGFVYISNVDVRFIGEISSLPVSWNISGRDIYSPIEAAGVMRRIGQGASPLRSVMYRTLTTLQNPPVAYWPCEDLSGATKVASGLPGKPAMGISGAPTFAADSSFVASAPLIQLNNSYISGVVPAYTSTGINQVRFLLSIPSTGATDTGVICRILTGGSVARWDLIYSTGGALMFSPFDAAGNLISGGSGFIGYAIDGQPSRMTLQMYQTGGNVTWAMQRMKQGNPSSSTVSGALTGQTVTVVQKVVMGTNRDLDDVAVGHITVESQLGSVFDLGDQLKGYAGEVAGVRIRRLCAEEGVSFQPLGSLSDTRAMGAQGIGTLLDLLKDCAEADGGLLGESRSFLALTYRSSRTLYNQPAFVQLPYTSLSTLQPIDDDQQTRNDITATRTGGSSYRATKTTGRLSVSSPPNGVGRYENAVTVNVQDDDDLPDQAGWRVHLGTVDEARYPTIDIEMLHPSISGDTTRTFNLRSIDPGDRFVITNPPAGRTAPGDISVLVQGYTETIEIRNHRLTLKCSPESPWETATYQAAGATTGSSQVRYESDGTFLSGALTTTTTTFNIDIPSGPLWNPFGAPFGFDIMVAGERMTVVDINNGASPQSFTVVRSVNGVVKTHAGGEAVVLWPPPYYAL